MVQPKERSEPTGVQARLKTPGVFSHSVVST